MQSARRTTVLSCAVAAALAALAPTAAHATVAFTGAYTQNFDSLASSGTISWVDDSTTAGTVNSLPGWFLQHQTVTPSPDGYHRFRTGTGSSSTGQFYSFGVAGTNAVTERAIGILGSTTVDTQWMALRLENTSTSTITSININFDAEQWRVGTLTSNQTLTFGYKVEAGSISESFSTNSSLNFATPKNASNATSGALDGNDPLNRAAKTATLSGLNWEPGQDLWIRWSAPGNSGSHGFGVDNVSVTAASTTAGAGSPTWNLDTNANWEAPGVADASWLNSNAPAATANLVRLGSQITADRTVTLNTSPTVTTLEFNGGAHDYTLAATGGNQLNVAAGGSIVTNGVSFASGAAPTGGLPTAGTQITAPLHFATDASFRVNNPLAKLTVTGNITVGAGGGLTLGGTGSVVLPAGFNWSGPTTLDGANLSVATRAQLGDGSATNTLALANGGNLTVTADMNLGDVAIGNVEGVLTTDKNVTLGNVEGPGLFSKKNAGTVTVNRLRTGGLYMAAADRTGNLSAGTVKIAPSGGADSSTSVIKFLRFESQSNGNNGPLGALDITDNKLIIDYDLSKGNNPIGQNGVTGLPSYASSVSGSLVHSRVAVMLWNAYAGGHWTGTMTNPTTTPATPVPAVGITSSLAQTAAADPVSARSVAYAEASRLLGISGTQTATWGGQTVDATSILVMYTWGGDANMDGKIDGDDYALVDRQFQKDLNSGNTTPRSTANDVGLFDATHSQWQDGDFNYDCIVNAADYLIIDRSFLATHPGSPAAADLLAQRESQFGDAYVSGLLASVPEPTALSVLALGALPLLSRRRRA